ncbi:MAG: prepilin peptidase [Patescibacteria group bacterium]
MVWIILFVLGLAIGSFLNVVSLRYEPGNKIFDLKIINGRSNCFHCHTKLKWYELIPLLSFIIQFGKCRSCGNRLSWQYPLVELLSGLIFVLVPLLLLWSLLLSIAWILIFLLFLLLSIIDFRHYIIPDSINLSLAILGAILTGIYIFQSNNLTIQRFNSFSFLGHYSLLFNFWPLSLVISHWSLVISHFIAAFIAMAFVAAIIILSRGRGMGWGDFKLVGALGLIFGWPDILMILFLSFIIGSIFVLPLLVKKQKTMKDVVPFGPFLIIAATLTFFLGYQIIDGYFKLFSLV